MSKYDLAQNVTTRRMQARSYAEYTAKVAANWGKLMSLISDATNVEQDDLPASTPRDGTTPIEEKVNELLQEYGVDQSALIPLVNGAVSAKNLVTTLVTVGVDISNWDGERPMPDEFSPLFSTDQGNFYSISSLGEELQATYHAVAADMAVMEGFSISDKAAEIISVARDKMSSIFSDGFSDISNTLENKIAMVKSGFSISDYIDSVVLSSGLHAVSQGEAEDFSLSPDVQFTGASPASAYCWDTLADSVSSTVRAAASAAKSAFGWLTSKVSKLFHKVEVKVREIVTDPYDIELVNESDPLADFYVDGYFIQRRDESAAYGATTSAVAAALAADLRGKSFMFDFTFGTILMSIKEASVSDSNPLRVNYTYDIQMKPKPVDFDLTAARILSTARKTTIQVPVEPYYYVMKELQFSQLYDTISATCTSSSLSVLTTSATEVQLLRGFLYGRYLLNTCSVLMHTQAIGGSSSTWSSNLYYELLSAYFCGRTWKTGADLVTNQDFYKAVTEVGILYYNDSDLDIEGQSASGNPKPGVSPVYHSEMPIGRDYYADLFAISQEEEILNPLSFEWLPYASNGIQWSPGKFRIRTDAENLTRFNNFLNSAILIVGAVVVTVVTIIVLKKVSTKAFLKLQGALWNATDEASKGSLSKNAIRAYKRANLKSKLLSSLSGSLKTGASAAASSVFQNMPNPFISDDTVKNSVYPDVKGLYTAIGVPAPRTL